MKKGFYIFLLVFFLLLPSAVVLANAAGGDHGLGTTAQEAGLQDLGSIPVILGKIAGAALALAGSMFLFLIIYGGIIIMTSAGSDRVKKGKDIITWAIIGALLLGAAYAITAFIFGIFTPGAGTTNANTTTPPAQNSTPNTPATP